MAWLRAHGVDLGLVLLAAVVVATSLGESLVHVRYGSALAALALAALLFRRRLAPLAAVVCFALMAWANRVSPQISGPVFVAFLVSFGVAGTLARRWAAITAWGAGCAAMIIGMAGNPYVAGLGDVALTLTFCTLIWAAGLAAAEWGRQAGLAQAHVAMINSTRDRDLAAATAHERARIAGELHDIVSHGLSIVILQTVAARIALHDAEHPVSETDRRLGIVELTARNALDDMRRMLDLLRPDPGAPGDEVTPSVGLDQLPALLAQADQAGVTVRSTVEVSTALPPGLDAAAYRILQEAITNAIKHAPGAEVRVDITATARMLDLTVESVGGAAPTVVGGERLVGAGYGLVGMRQRAELYGGTFDAIAVPDGFRVTARLPLDGAA